jgi:hypothetical protein
VAPLLDEHDALRTAMSNRKTACHEPTGIEEVTMFSVSATMNPSRETLAPTTVSRCAGLLAALMVILASSYAMSARAQGDTNDCSPRLVRAVTHFPASVQQFHGDGIVELALEVDRSGRVLRADIANTRASPELYEVARVSALNEWAFDVNGCRAFPAHAVVRVEYQRPPVHTFSASQVRSRALAAALPANADCVRNEAHRFEKDSVMSCLINAERMAAATADNRAASNVAVHESSTLSKASPTERTAEEQRGK